MDTFTEWARDAEPHLREALTALFGVDAGVLRVGDTGIEPVTSAV